MRARPAAARGEQNLPRTAECRHHFLHRLAGSNGDVLDWLRDVQQVASAKLSLRIVRSIAVRLDAEAAAKGFGILAQQRSDLLVGPDVEGAF